jgi:hypothetical protein
VSASRAGLPLDRLAGVFFDLVVSEGLLPRELFFSVAALTRAVRCDALFLADLTVGTLLTRFTAFAAVRFAVFFTVFRIVRFVAAIVFS